MKDDDFARCAGCGKELDGRWKFASIKPGPSRKVLIFCDEACVYLFASLQRAKR